ncbi:MAG: class I SAM-dependent methyltransferase [Methylococcales bacterium]
MLGNLFKRLFSFPPAVIALFLQFTAIALALLCVQLLAIKVTAMAFAFCSGILAAVMAYIAKLPLWWLVLQFLFAPALVVTLTFNIPAYFFLAAFLIMMLVYWNTYRTQVPFYLSSNKVWHALGNLLPQPKAGRGFTFIDIGSGFGGVLTYLASIRPDGDYSGVESAPLPFVWSWLRIRLGGYRQCRVHWGDFWAHDLADYDVVFAYLSPVPMERLWRKAKAEMRPGSLFISNSFTVPGQTPYKKVKIDDLHQSTLLVWRM